MANASSMQAEARVLGRPAGRLILPTTPTVPEAVRRVPVPTSGLAASRGALAVLVPWPRVAIAVTIAAGVITTVPGELPVMVAALDLRRAERVLALPA